MKKVLLATEKPFAAIAVEGIRKILNEAGYEMLVLDKYVGQEPLIHNLADVDALIIRSDIVDRKVIDSGSKLKIIVRAGAGYDNIDLRACTEKGVIAMNTPGQNSNAVAELVIGMILYFIRQKFNGDSGNELRGKSIGLHGFGWVAKHVAWISKGFGMNVNAYDPFVGKEIIENEAVTVHSDLQSLYKSSQFVSLHIPFNDDTNAIVNHGLLSLIPHGACLINTARKEVVSEPDLLRIFGERKDFSYLADVSPDIATKIAILYPGRFFFTPKKMGAQTEEANNNAGLAAARQIVDFFERGDTRFKVN
jgi:D-3-phosphoglycerate dehydrogenase / 2-oxoglutarate reductase